MARARSVERLEAVALAATDLFGQLGYRRTQMAEVAKAAGISTGAIYSYVESKEALFHLVFVRSFRGFEETPPTLPLANPAPGETLRLLSRELEAASAMPVMSAALACSDPPDIRSELTAVVGERFDLVAWRWPILAVIERCAVDLPDLDELYYGHGRRSYLGQLEGYLARRMSSGHLRTTPDPDVTGRMITELVAWWAWHRLEDREVGLVDAAVARRSVVEFVCDALIVPEP